MPKSDDFFKEANALCDSPNLLIARTAEALYRRMLQLHQAEGIKPGGDFNILFFFQSVIRAIASYAKVGLSPDEFYASSPIEVVNPVDLGPPLSDGYLGQTGVLGDFLDHLKTYSKAGGMQFDAEYAVRVVTSAIDEKTMRWICGEERDRSSNGIEPEEDFDYWLSGFNEDE